MALPLGRLCTGFLVSALTALTTGQAAGQGTPEPIRGPSLSYLLEDRDGDLVPDRVGGRFEIRGYATMEPRPARTVDSRRWYFVTIQDDSAGIRLLTDDLAKFVDILEGTQVVAVGSLSHRRGTDELLI